MKRIHLEAGSLLTGSEIADALVDYTAALTRNREADVVEIPIVTESGRTTRARVVVGPATAMWTAEEPSEADEPSEPEFIQRLRERIARLDRYHGLPWDAVPGT